jgi:hypothetical protein
MIAFTFDQDWAPDWAVEDLLAALDSAGLCGTLFVTHDSPILDHLRQHPNRIELAIHPNYLPGSSQGGTTDEILNTLHKWVPEAKGVRAHCLIRSTPLLLAYGHRGFTYEASDLMDGQPGLTPMRMWNGVVRIPIYFEDDVHLMRGRDCAQLRGQGGGPGLRVFSFHPVLLALNCATLASYQSLKQSLGARGIPLTSATREHFAEFEQTDVPGLRDLFLSLLHRAASGEMGPCLSMNAIAEQAPDYPL